MRSTDILFGDLKLLISITTELELFSMSNFSVNEVKFVREWSSISTYDKSKIVSVSVVSGDILRVIIE